MPEPVLYPEKDEFSVYEWEGGCEDPRIVETKDGRYFLYYTSYNGKVALLCCAESTDLVHWKKHGPIFKDAMNGKYKTSGQNPAQLSAGRRVTTFIRSSSRKPTGCTGEKVTFMLPPPMI